MIRQPGHRFVRSMQIIDGNDRVSIECETEGVKIE